MTTVAGATTIVIEAIGAGVMITVAAITGTDQMTIVTAVIGEVDQTRTTTVTVVTGVDQTKTTIMTVVTITANVLLKTA
jgi:hypothetical protein